MEYIPHELVNQILLRLSVKDLLRFKCVCKSWWSHISSPYFITDHVEFNKKNPNYILAKFKDRISADYNISILNHETLEVLDTHHDFPHIPNIEAGDTEIVGSCNGVVCLRYYSSINMIILWNPATRDTKLVPISQWFPARELFSSCRIGFGFDAGNNDYKVVRIHGFCKKTDPFWIKIEIYSLKTDSWRWVTSSDQYVNFYSNRNYLCSNENINGKYSWLGFKLREGRPQEKTMITFDMNNESLISTPLPTNGINITFGINYLIVIDGSLAFIDEECSIWVLGEYGVKESWTKLFTVPMVKVGRPLGYWRNRKLFMETDRKQNLLDLVTQETSIAPIVKHWKVLQVISFKESLVPVSRCI